MGEMTSEKLISNLTTMLKDVDKQIALDLDIALSFGGNYELEVLFNETNKKVECIVKQGCKKNV